jgi:hypothetical protein
MLSPSGLASALEQAWLVGPGGSFPASPAESADRFAGAVAGWFATAMAATFPCTTASARRSGLAAQAAAALQAGAPPAAGALLAVAVATYYAGQSFGAGVASFPTAVSAGVAAVGGAFAVLDLPRADRAQQIAQGCYAMAVSTIVVFPVPLPPAPVF